VKRLLAVLVIGLTACSAGGRLSDSVTYEPPPPLALVAIVDPSSDGMASQLRQLGGVIQAGANPGEALVVMLLQARSSRIYLVRKDDSLSAIAAANGFTLAELEAANPQFGPLSGRSWGLIYQGEKVTLPDRGAPDPLALVTRAPAGPSLPQLVRLPQPPDNPTDFQKAQYERTVAADKATNDSRIAAWRAEADRSVQPWQAKVAGDLDTKVGARPVAVAAAPSAALIATVAQAVTTLQGLHGRRTLLILGGGDGGPAAMAPRSLEGINVVVANVADPTIAATWTKTAKDAGAASVSVLDPALTQLQLAQIVNQQPSAA
jgi:LysM repeat protein